MSEEKVVAKKGDKVAVHYIGTHADGTVFDSSVHNNRPPLEFVIGSGMMIKGFDAGVIGMAEGETKMLHLTPDEAYGPVRQDMFFTVGPKQLPKDYKPTVGDKLQAGQQTVTVAKVNEDGSVVIDANHELAGKDLYFEVYMQKIN